jgi:hypothetical protein
MTSVVRVKCLPRRASPKKRQALAPPNPPCSIPSPGKRTSSLAFVFYVLICDSSKTALNWQMAEWINSALQHQFSCRAPYFNVKSGRVIPNYKQHTQNAASP